MDKATGGLSKTIENIEKFICFAALILMALLPVVDTLLRPFNIFITYSRPLMIRLFLVSGLFAAMLTTKAGDHISIAIIQYAKNEKLKNILSCITCLISAFIATVLFWDSISFLKYSFSGRTSGFISDVVFALAMPIAYCVIAVRFAFQSTKADGEKRSLLFSVGLPVLVLLLGSAAALPAIAKIFWGFDPPEPFYTWVNQLYDLAYHLKLPLILFLVVSALAGTPIFAAIGGIAMVMLQALGGEPDAAPIQIYSALTDADLVAIPLFTLTGFFLSESKAGERLVTAFRSLFSWLPGGLIIATVVICAFFTSFTGASGVTILALGGILLIILQKGGGSKGSDGSGASLGNSGYPEKFSIGLLTSAGGIGILFPPSLPIILVGSTTNSILFFMGENVNYSIIDFFLGAIVPGLILVAATIVYGIAASVKVKIPVEPFNLRETGSALKGSAFEILLPILLVTGYFSGILSLVEVSAVSAVYVFIVEVVIHRDIAFRDIPKVFLKAVPIIGGILSIFAMAKALSYAIVDSNVPENLVFWMQQTIESKFVFLLILNLILLVVGCLMDIFSAIMVVLPLIIPLGQLYGIDPVHLGIIFIVNLEAGFLTPPVGMNLFLASYRFKKPFAEICRYVLPFLAVRLVVVLLVTYIPALSTFLTGLFG
ncbi:MAG: TRAP transporter large permease subunit [Treponema sp.]|jgi:tripartite ATP-independent transporter DctM subunit|nr:TRAP transporter large permease subunit [Treponema sp.]